MLLKAGADVVVTPAQKQILVEAAMEAVVAAAETNLK
jgi:hypothetical protein